MADITPVTDRVGKLGPKDVDRLRRDLVTQLADLNERLLDLQAQINVIKARLQAAGIP